MLGARLPTSSNGFLPWEPSLSPSPLSIRPAVISGEQADQLEADPNVEVLRIPGKVVASLKPGRRRKAWVVACGNYLHRPPERKSPTFDRRDVYSAGLDTISLRTQIATAAHRKWQGAPPFSQRLIKHRAPNYGVTRPESSLEIPSKP